MKKTILTLSLLCLISFGLRAQGYFEFGYNVGNMKSPNLNRSVYVYNYTRQWLSEEMPYFNNGKGFVITYGKIYDYLGYELSLSTFRARNIASGLEPVSGTVAYRRITRAVSSLNMGIPVRIINTELLEVNFVPSLDMKVNYVNTDYTHDGTFNTVEESAGMGSSFKIGSTMGVAFRFFPVSWLGISAKPYVSFSFSQTDVGDVQLELQGTRIPFVVPDPFTIYGISLSLVLASRDY